MEHACDSHCPVCGLLPLAASRRRQGRVIAESPAMRELFLRIARFAPADAPVAIFGETGTGKEVVARTLHANSPRASKPFVAINVAALPAELLESELFGHAKGSFTGATAAKRGLLEAADGGTLLLDEIAEMPLALQAKLLRALQDGEIRRVGETRSFSVDVRIVCATHRDLGGAVQAGLFREDLFYRLKVLSVRVPPLRERREDVLPLACHFLREERRDLQGYSAAAKERLLAHAWPGNVRELQSSVKHGAALARGAEVTPEDLPEDLADGLADGLAAGLAAAEAKPTSRTLRPLADVEREHILRVLDSCEGSQVDAARVLGIARNTLWRKLRTYA